MSLVYSRTGPDPSIDPRAMFNVTFTPEARSFVASESTLRNYKKPGVMVRRQGPKGVT